jgi:hypothetical protein
MELYHSLPRDAILQLISTRRVMKDELMGINNELHYLTFDAYIINVLLISIGLRNE